MTTRAKVVNEDSFEPNVWVHAFSTSHHICLELRKSQVHVSLVVLSLVLKLKLHIMHTQRTIFGSQNSPGVSFFGYSNVP